MSVMQEALLNKYLESLESKAKTIKALWERYLEGDKGVLDDIRLHAHSLKGSGGTFGFPDVSKAGGELEKANDTEFRDKLVALLNVLGRESARKSKQAPVLVPVPVSSSVQPNTKALIIERNPENARIISKCVGQLDGITACEIVGTGAQAREACRLSCFSLIVLDIVLPDQDGREILRELKNIPDRNTPVLVISGVPSDQIYLECMKLGADQYLSKPFDTDRLLFEAGQIMREFAMKTTAPVVASQEKQETHRRVQLRGEKILVAEDDEMQALFIQEKLQEEGAEVIVVSNGLQALEALEKGHHSVVILDGLMPEMNGFEALTSIRATPRLKGIPVIMVTAMGSEEDIIRGYECGANDYILKPFSEEQLIGRIKSLLVMAA